MRYVAAYMLAVLGGNDNPSADDIKTIIESVGIEVDENSLNILLEKLKGKNIDEVQKLGLSRLETISALGRPAEEKPEITPLVEEPVIKSVEKPDQDVDDDSDDSDGGGIGNLFG